MTSQHDKPKRWRLRFSIRTMVVVVTLACAYAACWGPTKRQGVEDVSTYTVSQFQFEHDGVIYDLSEDYHFYDHPTMVAPLIASVRARKVRHDDPVTVHFMSQYQRQEYYFWFFGFVAKLPYERRIDRLPDPRLILLPATPVEAD